jgi:hypothetical protein
MSSGGGDFKLGRIEPPGSVRLSGVTPGESVESPFHRVSIPAMASRSAHAKSDSLESSAALAYATFGGDQRPRPEPSYR